MIPDLLRRQRATEATLAKYQQQPRDWEKRVSCVHMAHHHLRGMGHTVPPLPAIRSATGALRALKKRGWSDVATMLDGVLPGRRIAPLSALLGDLIVVRGTEGMDAIYLHIGPEAMGWHEDASRMVPQIVHEHIGAWRV